MTQQDIFFHSASLGDIETLEALLQSGINVDEKDDEGNTALLLVLTSCPANLEATVRVLIEYGADVHATSSEGWTALMLASLFGETRVASLLLNHGANVNAQNDGGASPLLFAAANDRVEIVEMLLAWGADPNLRTQNGVTVVERIRQRIQRMKHKELLGMLVDASRNFSHRSESTL